MIDDKTETLPAAHASSSALKICLIARALPVHRLGGLEFHARDLAVALSRRGHEVHVLTTRGGGEKPLGASNGRVTVHEIPGTKPGDYSLDFFRGVEPAALAVCRQHEIDVLCPIDMAGLFLSPAKFSAAVLPIIHGTMTSEVPLDWRYRSHLGALDKLKVFWRYKSRLALLPYFRRMIQRADLLMVDSEFTRRELFESHARGGNSSWQAGAMAAALSRKIHVVPLGIDHERFPAPESDHVERRDDGVFRIGLLGRLQRIKGLEIAIRAAGGLLARGVQFEMNIAGTGEFEPKARDLVRACRLQDHVHFAGRVEPNQLSGFLSRQDVFLFPDLTQPAFGLVAVEAMQYDLPIIGAKSGAIPEVVTEDCGWLYDAWDVNELAGLLARLAANPHEVSQKAAATAVRKQDFTAGKMAERTERILLLALMEKSSKS